MVCTARQIEYEPIMRGLMMSSVLAVQLTATLPPWSWPTSLTEVMIGSG
jgi:hypothetical protein